MWRYNYVNSTELYHYGIPGMKWGQRIASKWNDHFDKRRVKLEEKYRNQGMSKKDAQIKAEKSVKGEKVTTGVVSGVVTAAIATAVGYGIFKNLSKDKMNKSISSIDKKHVQKGKDILYTLGNSSTPTGGIEGTYTTDAMGKYPKVTSRFRKNGIANPSNPKYVPPKDTYSVVPDYTKSLTSYSFSGSTKSNNKKKKK